MASFGRVSFRPKAVDPQGQTQLNYYIIRLTALSAFGRAPHVWLLTRFPPSDGIKASFL